MHWMDKAKRLFKREQVKKPDALQAEAVKETAVAKAQVSAAGKNAAKTAGVGKSAGKAPVYSSAVGVSEPDLLEMVRQAHMDWVCAQQRLNYALDADQIDYAVYSLEAAEKRYGMLLKQAKAAKLKADGSNALVGRHAMRVTG